MSIVLRSGDPRRQKLDAIEAQIAELSSQRATIAGATVSSDELRERCAAIERSERERIRHVHLRFRQLARPGPIPALRQQDDDCRDQKALDLYMSPEGEYAEKLFKALSSDPQCAPAELSAAERARRIAELDAALREQLVAEELEARRLEAAGHDVRRRPIAQLDIHALFEAWDQAAPELDEERIAAIPDYRSKGDNSSAPEWMQGGE